MTEHLIWQINSSEYFVSLVQLASSTRLTIYSSVMLLLKHPIAEILYLRLFCYFSKATLTNTKLHTVKISISN